MKLWDNIFQVVTIIIGVMLIAFNVLLYNFGEKQKVETATINKQEQIEAQVTSNQFKYQQEQIERLGKDLESAQQQIKDQNDGLAQQKDALSAQKDAFLEEVEKREQMTLENRNIQTSLVDIKAEADAIKQDMKGWQKDYVSVLAELEKKMDDSALETKAFEDNLQALNIPELKENINSLKAEIEKMTPPPDDPSPNTTAAPDPGVGADTVTVHENKSNSSSLGTQ
jgi:DNA repair exonuclease SbcCD ATPase subunit